MKLNILTVLFRKEFLEKQIESIPNRNDINWIICKTKSWGELPKEIVNNNKNFSTIIAEVDCDEIRENFVVYHLLIYLILVGFIKYFMVIQFTKELI